MVRARSLERPIVVVAGPTACGKSALALRLAQELQGEIFNLDSVQIYRGLDIGSAKLAPGERAGIAHHLLDIADPSQEFNVFEYCRAAEAALQATAAQPVFAGGSTMYLTSLLHGIAELPARDPELRASLEGQSSEELQQLLRAKDPEAAARLHLNDRVRVIRALETVLLSGLKLSELHQQHGYREIKRAALIIVPFWERALLYQRIEQRSAKMVESGLIEETKDLISQFGPSAPALRSLGYHQALKFLQGQIALTQVVPEIALFTRRYAKRQTTFWRNEPGKRGWQISAVNAPEKLSPEQLLQRIHAALAQGVTQTMVWLVDPHALFLDT